MNDADYYNYKTDAQNKTELCVRKQTEKASSAWKEAGDSLYTEEICSTKAWGAGTPSRP